MNANVGEIGTIHIMFRERFNDSIVYANVIGYQVGGGALSVMLEDGENIVIPIDLIQRISFKINKE